MNNVSGKDNLDNEWQIINTKSQHAALRTEAAYVSKDTGSFNLDKMPSGRFPDDDSELEESGEFSQMSCSSKIKIPKKSKREQSIDSKLKK